MKSIFKMTSSINFLSILSLSFHLIKLLGSKCSVELKNDKICIRYLYSVTIEGNINILKFIIDNKVNLYYE